MNKGRKTKYFLEYLLKGVGPGELGENHVLRYSLIVPCRIASLARIFIVLKAGIVFLLFHD